MNRSDEHAFFVAFSPTLHLAFGYVWKRDDFPWLGIWQENSQPYAALLERRHAGLRDGVRRLADAGTRREMIDRGRLFDVPTFRWIPANSRVEVGLLGDRRATPTRCPSGSIAPDRLVDLLDPDVPHRHLGRRLDLDAEHARLIVRRRRDRRRSSPPSAGR